MTNVSARDVARLAGVSVGTVSNVLNTPDIVSDSATRRVQEAIDQLGFVRNEAARQLRAGRSLTLGLIVPDSGNPFYSDLARGAEERAADDGLAVLLGNSGHDVARQSGYLDLFERHRVTGVVIAPLGNDLTRLERLADRGIPVVIVDRPASGTRFSSVSVDDVHGGRLAAEHLLEIGRRRLAFVGRPSTVRQVADRFHGSSQATALRTDATLTIFATPALSVIEGQRAGERIAALPSRLRPDGIVCANDLVAVGVLQGFGVAGGIRVPDDVALVGYDDISFARSAVVPLTSVRQPSALLGRAALERLLAESVGEGGTAPEHVIYRPELVVRRSTVRTDPPPPDDGRPAS